MPRCRETRRAFLLPQSAPGWLWLFVASCLLFALSSVQAPAQEAEVSPFARVLTVSGAIGPASADYLVRGMQNAEQEGASLVILRLDTPGGLDLSMRDIIRQMLASSIPVITYVSPPGARAASAGTYILYASHIAAMAPSTNLGAATPVQLGAPSLPGQDSPEAEEDEPASDGSTASERKALNDALAYIRSLAEQSGRNVEWAEAAVRDAATLSASEALAMGVIDLMADDMNHLLAQLDGREVQVQGSTVTLSTQGLRLEPVDTDWRMQFLEIITNPNLIIILGMIGIYGILLEFYNPGISVAGITGAICLLLAGYGLQLLPLNYAGLALVVLGLMLMVGEAFVPSFGVLGIGGVIAFSIGAIFLIDTDVSVFRVSLPMVAALASFTAALLVVSLRLFLRVRRAPPVTGDSHLIGAIGHCVQDLNPQGLVRVYGEIWQAQAPEPLKKGDAVRVTEVQGLSLHVEKVTAHSPEASTEIPQ